MKEIARFSVVQQSQRICLVRIGRDQSTDDWVVEAVAGSGSGFVEIARGREKCQHYATLLGLELH